jgi:hypothetical protein
LSPIFGLRFSVDFSPLFGRRSSRERRVSKGFLSVEGGFWAFFRRVFDRTFHQREVLVLAGHGRRLVQGPAWVYVAYLPRISVLLALAFAINCVQAIRIRLSVYVARLRVDFWPNLLRRIFPPRGCTGKAECFRTQRAVFQEWGQDKQPILIHSFSG